MIIGGGLRVRRDEKIMPRAAFVDEFMLRSNWQQAVPNHAAGQYSCGIESFEENGGENREGTVLKIGRKVVVSD